MKTRPLQVVLIAKAPVPGMVKTRLCPPCTPDEAALVAAAAIGDSVDALSSAHVVHRTLVVHGELAAPAGWSVLPQRGEGLGERLAAAFADTARPGTSTLLVGMDTPQLTAAHVDAARRALVTAEAAIGPAEDGGWWGLAVRDPAVAHVLAGVPMSTSDTGVLTVNALLNLGLRVARLTTLRDVDTAADAHAVAAVCPSGRFARTVAALVPR